MGKRQPRLLNWLYAALVIPLFVWGFYQQFYKSYPDVPTPSSAYFEDGPSVVSVLNFAIPKESPLDILPYGADVLTIATPQYVFLNKPDLRIDTERLEAEKQNLERQIEALKLTKEGLDKNIQELRNLNNDLSKISYEIQEKIIRFVQKNIWSDILVGAFVGSLVSWFFTYITAFPIVRRKIEEVFYYTLENDKNK